MLRVVNVPQAKLDWLGPDSVFLGGAFNEQYAAWHLYKGGPVALVEHVTVTRDDLIKYGP